MRSISVKYKYRHTVHYNTNNKLTATFTTAPPPDDMILRHRRNVNILLLLLLLLSRYFCERESFSQREIVVRRSGLQMSRIGDG